MKDVTLVIPQNCDRWNSFGEIFAHRETSTVIKRGDQLSRTASQDDPNSLQNLIAKLEVAAVVPGSEVDFEKLKGRTKPPQMSGRWQAYILSLHADMSETGSTWIWFIFFKNCFLEAKK